MTVAKIISIVMWARDVLCVARDVTVCNFKQLLVLGRYACSVGDSYGCVVGQLVC